MKDQPSLPELASSLRRIADSLGAGQVTTPLRENAAELRLSVLRHAGALAFKQIDSPQHGHSDTITRALAQSPDASVITSIINPSLSQDERSLLSYLRQAGHTLASISRGETGAGDSTRLRAIADGIAPQAGERDAKGETVEGARAGSEGAGPA